MNAVDCLFPRPARIMAKKGRVRLPGALALDGEPVPAWLRSRLAAACRGAGITLQKKADRCVCLVLDAEAAVPAKNEALRQQAYVLTLAADGSAEIRSPGRAGLQYGLVTLALLLEAGGKGAALSPVRIADAPVFRVRGVQVDMAREFFPSLPYLKRVVDRLADLKINTLWLYLENHFHAVGLEDLSPEGGMTPAEARAISAYGAERGIDVVPGTNVLSHMEGWFRLERYADFCDGRARSYPVLTRPETMKLVKAYLDQLAEAFPSPNFHAGLDELLFTGTNPEAAAAIERKGKPGYFADFAVEIIRYLKKKGKTVWMWDDMVLGKNIHRKEGFNDDYRLALDRFPRDTIMTHWYYWTNADGKHAPIIERVAQSGRPFVVAPSSGAFGHDYGDIRKATDVQAYMAGCGLQKGAFGLVNTHWESRYGTSFEATWPLLSVSAGFSWRGGGKPDDNFWRAFSFVSTGETDGAFADWLHAMADLENFAAERKVPATGFRSFLFLNGPQQLWRRVSPLLSPKDRLHMRGLLAKAGTHAKRIGDRDPGLKQSLRLPMSLFEECLNIIDAFDRAWAEYHRASKIERQPGAKSEFNKRIAGSVAQLKEAMASIARFRREVLVLEKKTGHTPYDAYALAELIKALQRVPPLMLAAARGKQGLPYFEKLLYLPDPYCESNLRQIQVQNTFHERYAGLPWINRRWPVK